MSIELPVTESEVQELLEWSEQHVDGDTTDHECGTYEEGVNDTLRWMMGFIHSRPDGV
ncbi:hypothetical protein [Marinobacterium stanieri]|uniref:hypothetical protein n=1 Tax=Marinobacterium stanieri TaxID=49186 RepID=UPI0002D9D053|nr:hypothetical protein [Marinobacterium stanieri]